MKSIDPLASGARRLEGKIAIVTGAGQGIGRATARRFAQEGATVVVAERNEETGKDTVDQILEAGYSAMNVPGDLSKLKDAQNVVSECLGAYKRIDIIANVVGGTIWWQPYEKYEEEQIVAELERSLFTTLWCCKAVLPTMIEQRSGVIVNFGSGVTHGGLYRVPYAVSKGGVEALTRTLAAENGRHGIRVNCVAPGVTIIEDRKTSRLDLGGGVMATAAPNTQALIEETRAARRSVLGRGARPEEQAAVAAFLASDDAGFVTGQTIDCNGGVF